MEITPALKTEIYHTLTDFLEAYKAEDTQVLAEKFDISGEFLEEIYEMLDFVEDKSVLHLFPIEEMDKEEGGGVNLEVYNFNNDDTAVGIEAHILPSSKDITTLVTNFLSLYFTTLVVKSLTINH